MAQRLESLSMASDLPSELWAKVFQILEADTYDYTGFQLAALSSDERRGFMRLQLVCRKFKMVLQEDADLMSSVMLHTSFKERLLPSLLKWSSHRQIYIKTLVADCNSKLLDMALDGLSRQDVSLQTAICRRCSNHSVHLLSSFAALKNCVLEGVYVNLDVSPLGSLPALQQLTLVAGHCTIAQLPTTLQILSLWVADLVVGAAHDKLKSLKQLSISARKLSILPEGLAACSGLHLLQCESASILSADAESTLVCAIEEKFHIPEIISVLLHITELNLAYSGVMDGFVPLSHIYRLTSLRHLTLRSPGTSLRICNDFTQLRSLTRLSLDVSGCSVCPETHILALDFDWAALQHLQFICILADRLKCDGHHYLLGMLNIQSLRTLETTTLPFTLDSALCNARLMYGLAKRCPQVCLVIDGDVAE